MNYTRISKFLLFSLSALVLWSCGDDDDSPAPNNVLQLTVDKLPNVGLANQYEGWIIIGDEKHSTGTFNISQEDSESPVTMNFTVDPTILANAEKFVLTVEPMNDTDPEPTDIHVLAGDFASNAASLTVGHPAAVGQDFTNAAGEFILATPSDGNGDMDEYSGVWFLDPSNSTPSLTLEDLPEDGAWVYEGWVVIDGVPISTGKFYSASGADDFSDYSSTLGNTPSFPGEDFLQNAPSGLTFPTDLRGKTVVISVEPVPDFSPAPYSMKPLVGPVASDAMAHTLLSMSNNAAASNPTGTASR